jgi:hypothetical protein
MARGRFHAALLKDSIHEKARIEVIEGEAVDQLEGELVGASLIIGHALADLHHLDGRGSIGPAFGFGAPEWIR